MSLLAIALAPGATLNIDENTYFDMAESLRSRWSLEVRNGLEVVDSRELLAGYTVKRGLSLVPAYPALYAVFGAAALGFGLRGLAAVNAIALGALLIGFFLLARRVLSDPAAFALTVCLPFCTPLFPYALVIMPHVLSIALVVWAVHYALLAVETGRPGRAAASALAAGVLLGVAVGVRAQEIIPAAVLAGTLALRARQRAAAASGFALGIGALLVVIATLNARRLGTFNPLTYGPAWLPDFAPAAHDLTHYLGNPGYWMLLAWAVLVWGVFRLTRGRPQRWLVRLTALTVSGLGILGVPELRSLVGLIAGAMVAMTVDASLLTGGLSTSLTWHGWVFKAALQSSPFLVLGIGAALAWATWKEAPVLSVFAQIGIATVLVLSLRAHDVGFEKALGQGMTARYLLGAMVGLFLLSGYVVRELTFSVRSVALGAATGVAALDLLWPLGPSDTSSFKRVLVLYGSLALAAALPLAWIGLKDARRALVLPVLVAATLGYSAALTLAEEVRAFRQIAGTHAEWVASVSPHVPDRLVVVGWGGGTHGLWGLRAHKDVVFVDAGVDSAADVSRVLKAFHARGLDIFYFGTYLERVAPQLAGAFEPRPIITWPLLWKLEPRPASDGLPD